MIRSGLIGRSILASRSPWLHEQEARSQGLSLSYELFDFSDRGLEDAALGPLLADLADRGFAGVNVTYPFKQAVIPLLDDLADSAALVGAVNTIAFNDGRAIGHNTDMTGFAQSLERALPNASLGRVLQLGAGGAGAAVANALFAKGARSLMIADWDFARVSALCERLNTRWGAGCADVVADIDAATRAANGIVNATPMGMVEHPGTPIDTSLLSSEQWVADIVYFPLETQLLGEAKACGCETVDGSGMVIAQAALAFEIMTGYPADQRRMRSTFDQPLPQN
jgi:shikimate dehydrogenase